MDIVPRIKVGPPKVSPTAPAHIRGVKQGQKGPVESNPGLRADGTSTARRSTGINPDIENPIDPRMPNLSPP